MAGVCIAGRVTIEPAQPSLHGDLGALVERVIDEAPLGKDGWPGVLIVQKDADLGVGEVDGALRGCFRQEKKYLGMELLQVQGDSIGVGEDRILKAELAADAGAAQGDFSLGAEPSAAEHVLVDDETFSDQRDAVGIGEDPILKAELAADVGAAEDDFPRRGTLRSRAWLGRR